MSRFRILADSSKFISNISPSLLSRLIWTDNVLYRINEPRTTFSIVWETHTTASELGCSSLPAGDFDEVHLTGPIVYQIHKFH